MRCGMRCGMRCEMRCGIWRRLCGMHTPRREPTISQACLPSRRGRVGWVAMRMCLTTRPTSSLFIHPIPCMPLPHRIASIRRTEPNRTHPHPYLPPSQLHILCPNPTPTQTRPHPTQHPILHPNLYRVSSFMPTHLEPKSTEHRAPSPSGTRQLATSCSTSHCHTVDSFHMRTPLPSERIGMPPGCRTPQ